jgi:hypothetical protein
VKLKFLLLVAMTLSSVGCSSTGVIPMDQDAFMIGKKDGTPGLGESLSTKADVYREANDFCQSKGLEVMTLRVTMQAARFARLGSTELHFKCVPSGGVARPLMKDADAVIEIRNR